MYDWLSESLLEGGTVVTANRRLARVLKEHYALQLQASGATAWRSPEIIAWPDWLAQLCDKARAQETLPAHINAHQSQWLWEKCWRKEVGDNVTSIPNLVKLSRETWRRLLDWQVTIGEVAAAAQSSDQRAFAGG